LGRIHKVLTPAPTLFIEEGNGRSEYYFLLITIINNRVKMAIIPINIFQVPLK
jgi:hypothetical protein